MEDQSLREKVSTLPIRARDLVLKISPKALEVGPVEDRFILYLYSRSVRLFDASLVLLEKDLPEEALILGRSLFDEASRLAQIESSGAKRAALLLGWENDSITQKRGLIIEASKLGLEFDPTPILRKLDEEQKMLQASQNTLGIGKLLPFLTAKDAAIKYGRAHHYWTYALTHEMVHGSDVSFLFNREKVATHMVAINERTPNPDLRLGVICFVVASLLQAAKATASVFGWQGVDQLDRLFKEVTDLEERFVAGG